MPGFDSFDTLLVMIVFMAAVSALPTEEERLSMTFAQFSYAVFYRFLQNVCINVRNSNTSLGAMSRRVESTTSDAHGNVSKVATETITAKEVAK